MQDRGSPHFVGLDIGTQNVRCVVGIADQNDSSQVSIVGHGVAVNKGMRRGAISHIDDVVEAINKAVHAAERLSGFDIATATVNVNGSNVIGVDSKGVVAISSPDREVANEDRQRAEEQATVMQLPPNREIIQVFAKNYRLDGQEHIKDPVGMHGVRLEVDTHIVTAGTPNVRNLEMVLEQSDMQSSHKTVSGLAAAEAVMSREQKEAGTLLLDIGAGTTNMAVIEDGEVQHVAVIPVGGTHITNDLAIGLKTDLDIAEKVKLERATLRKPKDKKEVSVKVGKNSHSFDVMDIFQIIEARVDELMDLVEEELVRIDRSRKLPGGIVIVGGSSKIPNIAEFTKDKLELAARVGKLQPFTGIVDGINDPSYASAIGLMLFDMLLPSSMDGYMAKSGIGGGGMLQSLSNVFKRLRIE